MLRRRLQVVADDSAARTSVLLLLILAPLSFALFVYDGGRDAQHPFAAAPWQSFTAYTLVFTLTFAVVIAYSEPHSPDHPVT
jgi:hypothetical protein